MLDRHLVEFLEAIGEATVKLYVKTGQRFLRELVIQDEHRVFGLRPGQTLTVQTPMGALTVRHATSNTPTDSAATSSGRAPVGDPQDQ